MTTPALAIRPAALSDAPALAELHASAFAFPAEYWSAAMVSESLAVPATCALAAWEGNAPRGFLLLRAIENAHTAEILTLCVHPSGQRQKLATRLIEAGKAWARAHGAFALYLDVAEDNGAARALYTQCGFTENGRRKGYYTRPHGKVDAVLMEWHVCGA